jgi:arylesterase/paraoxonase
LWRGSDGRRVLFAINHANHRHSIEIFDVAGTTLTHRRTVTGPALVSPNDIVGVGPDAFYVTNDHGIASGWRRTAEDYLRLRLSRVYVFDGATFKEALAGIGGANGVNVSADGKSLYLSAASERAVHVYDRDPATGALARRATVEVPGFADNIELLANGDLLLGVHSKIFALLASFGDPSKLSPSHVMRLTQDGKGGFAARTVYYNGGEEISALSVAAARGDRLLMGAIFDPKIVDCAWVKARP